jgi:Type II secretory pathway, prepilin signal peptidase PulO and related peptidases
MDMYLTLPYIIIFLFGVNIGSFLNVCICRIPKGESIVTTPSHCVSCGKQLKWYELIPLFSWLALRGKCGGCGSVISAQYPLIEAVNGILWAVVFHCTGFSIETIFFCLMTSALIVLSVIDSRTFEIPQGINIFILVLGIIHTVLNLNNLIDYVIGFFAVSGILFVIFVLTAGRGIGGGDIKLMAVCGLLLGWKLIVLAFFIGCIIGSIIHVAKMYLFKAKNVLAMGPYLSVGIFISALWGDGLINWYLSFLNL